MMSKNGFCEGVQIISFVGQKKFKGVPKKNLGGWFFFIKKKIGGGQEFFGGEMGAICVSFFLELTFFGGAKTKF